MKRTVFVLLVFAFSTHLFAAQNLPAGSDEYAAKALKDWGIPGMAIAIVKDDKIVFSKGYGVRKRGENTPVDDHTLFAIGSCSKAFTAAALGILVDEGKIQWDDPVIKYMPRFQLYDPYVTREITIRDLLCHRSGLPAYAPDVLWWGSKLNRDELLERLRFLQPASSFRTTFAYQNFMFLAAGQIIPAVTGKSWDEFISERIFVPLHMNSSNTSTSKFTGDQNVATPHAKIQGTIQTIPWRNIDNIAPAGSINSSVSEMAQWIRLQLSDGMFEGKKILSPEVLWEMHSPQTIIPVSMKSFQSIPESHFTAYGLGWGMRDYRGRKILTHTGGIDGMTARVVLVPEEKLGMVLLANMDSTNGPTAVSAWIMDRYLTPAPAKPRDWSAELLDQANQVNQATAEIFKKVEEARHQNTKPSLELKDYAATYTDIFLGDANISLESGVLKLKVPVQPEMEATLEHWHFDTFRLKWKNPSVPDAFARFVLDAGGQIDQLKIDVIETPQVDPSSSFGYFSFQRKRE